MRKTITIVLTWALLFTLNPAFAKQNQPEILWDNYGVPHIYSKTTAGMYYAFGWAQMHNHANLLLRLYAMARGISAQYWGKSYVNNDRTVQRFNLAPLAQKVYLAQHAEYRGYLDAFVKGINDYAKAHPESINDDYKQLLPVTPRDVVAHMINLFNLTLASGDYIYEARMEGQPSGSNAMAIAGSRSASGHAMLMANPHLPWWGLFTMFEAHLNSPGFDAYGAALAGVPFLAIAFNNQLGWTHTSNQIETATTYRLTIKDGGYLLDGVVQPFKTRSVTLRIKKDDGTFDEEKLICKDAIQGPVISEKGDKAFAVRVAGLENPNLFEQYHKMAKAQNFGQFEAALKMMQMPSHNVIYADKAGNVMYLDYGNIPQRSEGGYDFWRYSVDGTKSKYIWTKMLPYDSLPKVFDPPSGFVQNCNDVPWTCTYPLVLNPKNYPAYVANSFWSTVDMREERAMNLIGNNKAITFDQFVNFKQNTGLEVADRLLGDLLQAAAAYPDSLTTKAAETLKAWDRKTDTASRGAVLFVQWCNDMTGSGRYVYKNAYSKDQPLTTPNGLRDPKFAAEKLEQAANEVLKKYGTLDVAWEKAYRFRSNKLDYPANGAPPYYGTFWAINYYLEKDEKFVAEGGESYVAITEFGAKPKALVRLSYGNSTQPGSKHIGDQLKLLSEKKLRPALLDRADILKNLEEREILNYR